MSPQAGIMARQSMAMRLLAGLVRCRRCGRKLTVRYTGTKHNIPRYAVIAGSSTMVSRAASPLAACGLTTPSRSLLQAVEPGAVAAAVAAERDAPSTRSGP